MLSLLLGLSYVVLSCVPLFLSHVINCPVFVLSILLNFLSVCLYLFRPCNDESVLNHLIRCFYLSFDLFLKLAMRRVVLASYCTMFQSHVFVPFFRFYKDLFRPDRVNPNGCPIRGTFYVTHEWNDYWLTKKLYAEGHEIADHSITHETTAAFKEADIDR